MCDATLDVAFDNPMDAGGGLDVSVSELCGGGAVTSTSVKTQSSRTVFHLYQSPGSTCSISLSVSDPNHPERGVYKRTESHTIPADCVETPTFTVQCTTDSLVRGGTSTCRIDSIKQPNVCQPTKMTFTARPDPSGQEVTQVVNFVNGVPVASELLKPMTGLTPGRHYTITATTECDSGQFQLPAHLESVDTPQYNPPSPPPPPVPSPVPSPNYPVYTGGTLSDAAFCSYVGTLMRQYGRYWAQLYQNPKFEAAANDDFSKCRWQKAHGGCCHCPSCGNNCPWHSCGVGGICNPSVGGRNC